MNLDHSNQEFYIGWQEQAPPGIARFLKKIIPGLWILVVLVAGLFVFFQRDFSTSTFEFKQETMLTGTLVTHPVPMLVVDHGTDRSGRPITQEILLVDAGKHGAEDLIQRAGQVEGQPLEHHIVDISGYLIYHDGHTLLEARDLRKNQMDHGKKEVIRSIRDMGYGTISGELADPKCFFGAMKPGEGKVHLSCAARCIAGGIPPVLKSVSADGEAAYYIVLDPEGNPVNQLVLPYVGDHVFLRGHLKTSGDWTYLFLDEHKPVTRLTGDLVYEQVMCKSGI